MSGQLSGCPGDKWLEIRYTLRRLSRGLRSTRITPVGRPGKHRPRPARTTHECDTWTVRRYLGELFHDLKLAPRTRNRPLPPLNKQSSKTPPSIIVVEAIYVCLVKMGYGPPERER